MVLLCMVSCVVMINNGHIGLHCLRNLKRKANEATNNFSGTAAGIGGSVCVNRLRPVEAVGGGMKDEALKLALEVLEQLQGGCTDHDDGTVEAITVWCPEVIDAIKQALAAPVQPVATLWQHGETGRTRITMPGDITDCDARWFKAADLYTTPPAAPVQEPVAVVGEDKHGPFVDWLGDRSSFYERNPVGTKFYTTPPAQPAPVQEPVAWISAVTGDLTVQDMSHTVSWAPLYTTPPAQPAPDYAWPTVADYEKDVGFEVNEAFKMAWAMARTTNALFT
jgi:hypothetical protein